jgi:hypothetical protein
MQRKGCEIEVGGTGGRGDCFPFVLILLCLDMAAMDRTGGEKFFAPPYRWAGCGRVERVLWERQFGQCPCGRAVPVL